LESSHSIIVSAVMPYSKRSVKYYVKKYLKKNGLREWLRVIASDKNTYKLKYFNIEDDENAAADE
jgi:large subunit ribosomal protein L22e